MCGQDGHIHEVGAKYDHQTGVMRYMRWCVLCVWSRVVHEEPYCSMHNPDGNVQYMDDAALRSHVEAGHGRVAVLRRDLDDQSVRRAA